MARSLARDARGVSTIEFALLAPTIFVSIMGLSELSYEAYVKAVLNGAIQKAARDSTIQGNNSADQGAALDQKVKDIVLQVVPKATFTSTRTNFDTYGAIAGEPFTDSKYPNNSTGVFDGICNHGESYTDVNSNGKYDLDLSTSGQGGANDVTKYTMTVTYKRLFPVIFLKWGDTVQLSSTTILKNQPYSTQSVNGGTTNGTCA